MSMGAARMTSPRRRAALFVLIECEGGNANLELTSPNAREGLKLVFLAKFRMCLAMLVFRTER
jgi:hypothetical protein